MAKRHSSLVPLSHDHHHGLALALRLRQGDKALLNDGWTHDRNEQARRVAKFYDDELRRHFKAEEDVVFPAMLHHVPQSSAMIEILIQQHREIERLVGEIRRIHDARLELNLVALGELLEKHIRIEERDVFETFQSQVPLDVVERVGEGVKRIYRHG